MNNQDVVSILDLQNLDLDILRLQSEIDGVPAEIKKIEDALEAEKKHFKAIEEEFKRQGLSQKKFEGDILEKKGQIQKYELQLNAVKTNEDYTKLLKEIAGVNQQIGSIEEQVLVLMEKAEGGNQEIAARKAESEEAAKKRQGEIAEKKKKLQEQNAQLEKLKARRGEQATLCKGSLYQLYEKFMQKKRAIALVPVEKNGTCGGCRRGLPPNIKNEVMKGKIIQCDSCSRLLFWPSAEIEAHLLQTAVAPSAT